MYGKKRITISKNNRITYAGRGKTKGGSWIGIGYLIERDGVVIAKFLEPKNMFRTLECAIILEAKTKAEIRKIITNVYQEEINNN